MPSPVKTNNQLSGIPSGITEEQLESLVSDADLAQGVSVNAAARAQIASETAAAVIASVQERGQVNLYKGALPTGVAKVSGLSAPPELFARARVFLANYDYANVGNVTLTTLASGAWTITAGGIVVVVTNGYTREYNTGTEAWAIRPASPLTYPTYCCAVGNVAYFMASLTGAGAGTAVYAWDTSAGVWTQKPSLPSVRYMAGCTYCPTTQRVYAIGGHTDTSSQTSTNAIATMAVFDPVGLTWSTRAIPYRMGKVRAFMVAPGKMFVYPNIMGAVADGAASANGGRRCFIYDTVADSWTETDQLPAEITTPANYYGTMAPALGGKVLVLPYGTPSSGARGRLLDYTAAPGSQWLNFAVSTTTDSSLGTSMNGMTGTTVPGLNGITLSNGCVLTTAGGLLALVTTNTDAVVPVGDYSYGVRF